MKVIRAVILSCIACTAQSFGQEATNSMSIETIRREYLEIQSRLEKGLPVTNPIPIEVIQQEREKIRVRMESGPKVPPIPENTKKLVDAKINIQRKSHSGSLPLDDPSVTLFKNILTSSSEGEQYAALQSFYLDPLTFPVFKSLLDIVDSQEKRALILSNRANRAGQLSPGQKLELFEMNFNSLQANQEDISVALLSLQALINLDSERAAKRIAAAISDGAIENKRLIPLILRRIHELDVNKFGEIVAEIRRDNPDLVLPELTKP